MGFRQLQRLFGCDIPRNDDNRVVGRVIRLVKGQRIFARQRLDLVQPADHRAAIGVVHILRGRHLLIQQGTGIAVGPLATFLDNDLPLGGHILFGKGQITHPVGFHLHHQTQTVRSHPLEIGGIIPTGKGVVIATLRLDRG